MAKPEQTEKATPKRKEEGRKRGQVPRSPELPGSLGFLAGVIILHWFFPSSLQAVTELMRTTIGNISAVEPVTIHSAWTMFAGGFMIVGMVLVVLFASSMVVGIATNLFEFGLVFTFKPLVPSFKKINPWTGLTRLFSKQVAVNLGKQILKLAAVVVVLFTTLSGHAELFAQVGQMDPNQMMMLGADVIYEVAWKFALLLVVIGVADYAYERWQLEDNMKMSKQEVKDEMRQAEGNPEAKAALKRRQREFARRRMMSAVPRATVVVTNPTHFAVALEWDDVSMEAPVVVAKGADLLAKRIREIAAEHHIPIMENPPLARTLYDKVPLDTSIPPNMYAAVAQVIAFVYKLGRRSVA
jgi:flagellar biosynthetic protein FlhB